MSFYETEAGFLVCLFVTEEIPITRARPDWTYEFPDRTGPDNQICRTGPVGLD